MWVARVDLNPFDAPERLGSVRESAEGCSKERATASLEDVYRQERTALVRLGLLLTGSRETAEDIVQDAFLRLQASSQVPEFPHTYLRQAVVNGAADCHRRTGRARKFAVAQRPKFAVTPELDETWQCVQGLPERQRYALVLRYYLDLSLRETAEALDCPIPTAKTLVRRGLQRMKRELTR
jgi:RNA polymerase sigma factor (sigma-70 family)